MTLAIVDTYEVRSTHCSDLFLDEQIALGANDWCCECSDGSLHYGNTREDAIRDARAYVAGRE